MARPDPPADRARVLALAVAGALGGLGVVALGRLAGGPRWYDLVYRAIYALGLRNPFTFGVQPGTGRIFINDVGQNTWEEINDGTAGANYGWPGCEGACSVFGVARW